MRGLLVVVGLVLAAVVVVAAVGSATTETRWWAVFRWIPESEPPARLVVGPFDTEPECRQWAVGFAYQSRGGFQLIRCIEIDSRLIP